MEVNRYCCSLTLLVVLVILIVFPVKCSNAGEAHKPLIERSENKLLKRFSVDYDSFVGLMGKRRAAPALNYADHILADMLQQKTLDCSSAQTFLQNTGFKFNRGKQRIQPSL